MQTSIESAAALPVSALAELFTASFAGYLMPVQMPVDALCERICAEDIHLGCSRVLKLDGEPAGLALIARRGRESRLAAMGVVPQARSRGVGRELLAQLLAEARARGDRRLRLEVFEANAPARAVYERAGFRVVTRLLAWELSSPAASPEELRELDAAEFASQLARSEVGRLSWQLAPASLSAPPAAARCFALEEASWAYLSGVSEKAIALRGILTLPERRRRGLARRLLGAIAARFPGRAVSVPQLVPEGLGAEFFSALGFQPGALPQLEMALEL